MTTPRVTQDAQDRAWRTLLQGLAFDVAAAVVLALFTAFSAAQTWSDLEWTILGFAVAKTIVVSGLSYLMRRVFADQIPPVAGG